MDARHELPGVERLRQKGIVSREHAAAPLMIHAGDVENWTIAILRRGAMNEIESRHVRQLYIHDEQSDFTVVRGEDGQGGGACNRGEHLVSGTLQNPGEETQNRGLVVEDEDLRPRRRNLFLGTHGYHLLGTHG